MSNRVGPDARVPMKWVRLACAIVWLVEAAAVPRARADALLNPYPVTDEDRTFLASLKDALTAHNVGWVADRTSLPIHAGIHGHRQFIRTRASFIAHFDEIFDERMRKAVLEQSADRLFKNSHGAMIGRGEIWFETFLGPHGKSPPKIYIIGINN